MVVKGHCAMLVPAQAAAWSPLRQHSGHSVEARSASSSSLQRTPALGAESRLHAPVVLAAAATILCGAQRHHAPRRRKWSFPRSAAATSSSKASSGVPKVVFLGDSVLDNFFWLETPKRHLRVQLQETLNAAGQNLECVNLAVDQMTTFDFEERAPNTNPWEPFAAARRKVGFDDEQDVEYRVDEDGKIRTVRALADLENVEWCILSVGGNDVYLKPQVKADLLLGRGEDCARAFGQRYRDIIASVRKAAPAAKLAIVIPYQPHDDFSLVMGAPIDSQGKKISGDILGDIVRSWERQNLSGLVTPLVKEILRVAQEEGCPVVDLSKTLDPRVEEHYGTGKIGVVNSLGAPWSGAEPSDMSTGFMATLLAEVVRKPPSAVVYTGVPRKDGKKQSLLVQTDANDAIYIEDYKFGPTRQQMKKTKKQLKNEEEAPQNWFILGITLTLLFNAPSVLTGGDVIGFNRDEFKKELKVLMEEEGETFAEPKPLVFPK